MSPPKGREEKEQGNAAFKAGDYSAAIGHYSAAILADPESPTYPLNRAAAYLKLGKNEDAERDCERVLALDERNVKAMFRRAQARVALQKLAQAKDDLQKALAIEPASDAVKAELKKVDEALRAQRAQKQKRQPVDVAVPPLASASSPVSKPNRRRVPIEIVEPPTPSTKVAASVAANPVDDMMMHVSSRPLTGQAVGSAGPLPASQPKTFLEAKDARTATRSGVGGGIFRPNGKHTIFSDKTTSHASSAPVAPPTSSAPPLKPVTRGHQTGGKYHPPKTLVEFSRAWDKGETAGDRWALLNEVSPAALPSMFQSSLEAQLLTSIVRTLRDVLRARPEQDTQERVREYMTGFIHVQRFSTVVLFMSAEEKTFVKEVWRLLGGGEGARDWGASL